MVSADAKASDELSVVFESTGALGCVFSVTGSANSDRSIECGAGVGVDA